MARVAVIVALAVLLAMVAGVALVFVSGAAADSAALTVFVGTADIRRAGSTSLQPARTGDRLASGDAVVTAAASKAALTYPDGSITRLDSDTEVTVALAREGGDQVARLRQASGLTWNSVRTLTGGARFGIDGPNHTSADVRGTEFGYYVEQDPTGAPVIWVDVWSGSVRVTGPSGPPVDGTTGQRVTVRQGAPAAAAVPIPAGDRQLDFTVFNTALDAVTGVPFAYGSGALATGQTAGPFDVTVDRPEDLRFVLSWPGSTFELTVVDPSGKAVQQLQSGQPPLVVEIKRQQVSPGTWHLRVRDVQSASGEPFWLVAAHS